MQSGERAQAAHIRPFQVELLKLLEPGERREIADRGAVNAQLAQPRQALDRAEVAHPVDRGADRAPGFEDEGLEHGCVLQPLQAGDVEITVIVVAGTHGPGAQGQGTDGLQLGARDRAVGQLA